MSNHNHKAKVKLARKMRSSYDDYQKASTFDTQTWKKRKEQRAEKLARRIKKVKDRKIERLSKQEETNTSNPIKKKLSQAEIKQIRRKRKLLKITNKLKSIV